MSDRERPEAANSPASGPTRSSAPSVAQFTAEVQTPEGLVTLAASFQKQDALKLAYGDYPPGSILREARNAAWLRGHCWCNEHAEEFPSDAYYPECGQDAAGGDRRA